MNKPLKIFITYAHKDKAAKDKLISYLGVMEKKDEIKFWDDNEIRLSDKWYKKISNNLATSDILFYLVSAASLASENCNRELAEALSGKIRVIPIILERCDWLNHQLSDIQVLPVEGKPINEWFPDSKGWQNVVENIQKAIGKIQSQVEASSGKSKKELHAELAFQQGNVLVMLEQINRAIEVYSHAIELNPNSIYTYNNRGVAYGAKGDYDRAIADYTKAIQLNPNYANAYAHRGVAYQKKGEILYAIQDYSTAIGLNPELAEAYTHRGNIYLSKIDIHRAIEDYNAAIKLNSDAGLAYGNCGVAWLHLQQWGNAKVDLTVAIILRVNISALFHQIYKSVADFEQRTGIQLPEDIAAMLNPKAEPIEFEKETRLTLALKGYENGELSIGLAARLAGMPYSEFLLLMSQHELSPIGETAEELASDFANAHKASDYQ